VRREEVYTQYAYQKKINLAHTSLSWVQIDDSSTKCLPLAKSIRELHENEHKKLGEIISEYNNIFGFGLDIEEELAHYQKYPCSIDHCISFLSEQLKQYLLFPKITPDNNRRFTFPISNAINRKYYIAAKLADTAIDIQSDNDNGVYFLTFDGTQIEEMALMLHLFAQRTDLYGGGDTPTLEFLINPTEINANDIWLYLRNVSFLAHLRFKIESLYSCSGLLSTIRHQIVNKLNNKADDIYREMIKENRVKIKWVNEHKLYKLIHKYVDDAIYQYQANWLGAQSLDVFLPSQNIAIEYQGEQHYQATEFFGGQEALECNIERDERKRKLCAKNGVTLLEWKYTKYIDEVSVLSFLEENNVMLVPKVDDGENNINSNPHIEMAPVIVKDTASAKKSKPAKKSPRKESERLPRYILKQYSLDGEFIANYSSYKSASSASEASAAQIGHAVNGRSKTAGGYQWRMYSLKNIENNNSLIESTEPIEAIERKNEDMLVFQITVDGEPIAMYESVWEAARSVGVKSDSIRDVLKGNQETAGGFRWMIEED